MLRVREACAAVDTTRIQASIEQFSGLSETQHGVTRLGYTPLEREAHGVFREAMSRLGAKVWVDEAGNTIAELGAEGGLAGIGTGSHLDSVPLGGRFDGIAGVAAAMEVARVVVSEQLPRRRPWRFVAFANEEGARFGQACNGSRAVAGALTQDALATLTDYDGVTLGHAMATLGFPPESVPAAAWDPAHWHGFIELHIEQGNVLEAAGIPIGIVDGISGSTRFSVTLRGVASHTGGTPMAKRKDALVAAAECVAECERVARDSAHFGTRVTVGSLEVHPGSITTIPGEVVFSVDVRDVDSVRQRETASQLLASFGRFAGRRGIALESQAIGDISPVPLPVQVTSVIATAAQGLGLPYRVLSSGASHDSQQVNAVTPTGMIFVPSRDGLSHVPEEWTAPEDIAVGTRLLLASLISLDTQGA